MFNVIKILDLIKTNRWVYRFRAFQIGRELYYKLRELILLLCDGYKSALVFN